MDGLASNVERRRRGQYAASGDDKSKEVDERSPKGLRSTKREAVRCQR